MPGVPWPGGGLLEQAESLQPRLTELRRRLHRVPELGLVLPQTEKLVREALTSLPLEIATYEGMSAIVAVLRGRSDGPVILLRGDMDALPIVEATDVEYASDNGAMHACGHDLHTAMLVGAAHLLSARSDTLDGSVVFMFQPGEEGYDGAQRMIDAGVLDAAGKRPDAAYALHVNPAVLPFGTVATRPGTLLSAVGQLSVTVNGRGGHASRPHRAADPVSVAAEMIVALQTLVTRQFDAFDPVIVSVGVVEAGTKFNIIPEAARFEASVRTFSAEHTSKIAERGVKLCQGIADAHGLTADAVFTDFYPTTVNDADEAQRMLAVAAKLFGPDHVHEYEHPQPGSEDFSRVLERVPGAMAFLGACPPGSDPDYAAYNHSPHAAYDDAVLSRGAALLAGLAVDRMTTDHISTST